MPLNCASSWWRSSNPAVGEKALPSTLQRDLACILIAGFLRAVTVGFLGVVLAIFLFRNGFSSPQIGFVIGAGLAGTALATIVSAFRADALGRRRTLVLFTLLTALPLLALAVRPALVVLLPISFLGMLNAMGTDRSALFAIEQAVVPGLVGHSQRTWALSWYNVVLDTGTALGSLLGGLPVLLGRISGLGLLAGYRDTFYAMALLTAAIAAPYLLLSPTIEVVSTARVAPPPVSPDTRRVVRRLAALFSLDAFGGGLLADVLLSYWFFRRFGVSEQGLGLLFALIHVLNATSHLGAAWLARRIGLVNTMVFTHLPSSLFLLGVPFAPSFPLAAGLLLLRESLVEMDVPTRQSYTAAVVRPEERTYAAGVTNLARNAGWAASTSLSGIFMHALSLAAPIFIGSSLKIAYDIALFLSFRKLKPPEETPAREGPR